MKPQKNLQICNWTSEERYEFRAEAVKVLNDIKKLRKNWKFQLFPHPNIPETWIERRLV